MFSSILSSRQRKLPHANRDDDYFCISSEIQSFLAETDTQLSLAKVRIVKTQEKVARAYHGFVTNDAKEFFRKQSAELQAVTMEIQSLRSDVSRLNSMAENARDRGKAPHDNVEEVPRHEMADMSWLECQRYFLELMKSILARLEEI